MSEAESLIEEALREGRTKLLEHESYKLLAGHGLPVPEYCMARSLREVPQCSTRVRYPHVLKVVSPDILHKSDVGGVALGTRSVEEDLEAYKSIMDSVRTRAPGVRVYGVLVQWMVPKGLEVIVGGIRDRFFDIVVMFGLGGVFVEVLRDVSFRAAPLEYGDTVEMIDDIRARKILYGVRGMPPRDREAIAKIIYGVYSIMERHRNIREIDLNPVMSYERGAYIADARIIISK